jgi:hypothetical protein
MLRSAAAGALRRRCSSEHRHAAADGGMAADGALLARTGGGAGRHRGRTQHRAAAAPGGGDGARRCWLGAAGGRMAGKRGRPCGRGGRGRLCPGSDRPGGADPPRLRPLRGMPAAAGCAGCSACRRRALQRGQRARRCTARVGGPAEQDRRRRGGVEGPHAALRARSPQRALAAGGGRGARSPGRPCAPSAARAAPGMGPRLRLRRATRAGVLAEMAEREVLVSASHIEGLGRIQRSAAGGLSWQPQ